MKDKILEKIKTKFQNLGVDNDILDGFAEMLAKSITDENGIDDGVNSLESTLKNIQKSTDRIRGKYSKELDELKKVLKEKEVEKETPKKIETENEDFKKLLEEFSQLKNSLKERDKRDLINSRKIEISKLIKNLPKSLQVNYQRINVDIEENEFEKLKKDISGEVSEIEKDLKLKGATFKPPFSNNENQGEKLTVEDIEKMFSSN